MPPQQGGQQLQVPDPQYQQLLVQAFQPPDQFYQRRTSQESQQRLTPTILPSQTSAPEPAYNFDQVQCLPTQVQRQLSQVASSQYGTPYQSPPVQVGYTQPSQPSRKRSHQESFALEYAAAQQHHATQGDMATELPLELTPHGHHAQLQVAAAMPYAQYSYGPTSQIQSPDMTRNSSAQPQHHHHRLPNQQPPNKSQRTAYGDDLPSTAQDIGAPNVVGQAGMPSPAARPKGPKLKFTSEDDILLVELKEKKNLTWKQIADFFPGRSSGTLQVRYCTKLKAKTAVWTDEMIQRLRVAIEEYDQDRWRIISSKVGNGFSAAACQEKADEMEEAHAVSEVDGNETGPVSAVSSA